MLKAALSITAQRILSETLPPEDDDITSSYNSRKIDNANGYKILKSVAKSRYYLKSQNRDKKDVYLNLLDIDRVEQRISNPKECMILYLPIERI